MALTDYDLIPTARRVLNLFLMIDTSGSMYGEKIAAVNDAIRNVLPIITSIDDDNPDAEIKISALTFAGEIDWLTPTPVRAADFKWNDMDADSCTRMGEAIRQLSQQLSHKHGMLASASGSYAPVIIMLSDGAPTDDFHAEMAAIMSNNWFVHSMRIAIAIGSDADINVLRTFTGNSELVFRVQNIDALKNVIKATVVTSTMVASRSSSVGAPMNAVPSKSAETASLLADELSNVNGLSVGDEELIDGLDFDDFD